MIRKYGLLLFCIILLLLLVACRQQSATWQRIQETGVLRVGLDPTFPPFETADGVPLQGLDVDLAKAIADDLGLTVEFVYFGYDGLYDALATGRVDVLISALVIMVERTRDFAYSDPYFNAGELLIVPDGSPISGMAGLANRRLAVELGAQGHVEATIWERRLTDLTILPYNTPDEAITAVAENEADAALIDAVSGRLYLREQPQQQLTYLPEPVTVEPYALVVRREDERLLDELNDSLSRLRQSGQLEQIIAKWLGP
jgi:arginine/lysine/histidine transporter system substrate-binding protein